jgi:spore coat polysaccharide biosynthesis protein SpsF (cytidylyltransferase family)
MSIVAIIQARMSSSRLPGKVLMEIDGVPILDLIVKRLSKVRLVDRVVVATSSDVSDDVLYDFCKHKKIECIRGELEDVLSRFKRVAECYPADHYLRITADCPLIDPELISILIYSHINNDADYSSNALEPTYPDGYDSEVIKSSALIKAFSLANKKSEREHVTYYIYTHPDEFKINSVRGIVDYSKYRLTVDTKEDYDFICKVVRDVNVGCEDISFLDVVNFLKCCDGEYFSNKHNVRNEGLLKSIGEDA